MVPLQKYKRMLCYGRKFVAFDFEHMGMPYETDDCPIIKVRQASAACTPIHAAIYSVQRKASDIWMHAFPRHLISAVAAYVKIALASTKTYTNSSDRSLGLQLELVLLRSSFYSFEDLVNP